ncbi:S-layer homology domain-containing protein [Cohnella boryungensis]|uniref:S-layer homology domain-containing protein n=1 Tax=Cohnella boryungensis TaxID=768479 RepID=A0ABV8S9U3_9BACL
MYKLFRKSLSIIIALSIVLSVCSVAAAAPSTIRFLMSSPTGKPGEEVAVNITVEFPADGLYYSYNPYVGWDVPTSDARFGNWESNFTAIKLYLTIAEDAPSGSYPVSFDRTEMEVERGTTAANAVPFTGYETVNGTVHVLKQVSVGQASGSAGSEVEVSISTNSTEPISSYEVTVPYDSSVFEVVDVTPAEGGALSHSDNGSGGLTVNWDNDGVSSLLMTNGELFKIKFKIKTNATLGSKPLNVSLGQFKDQGGGALTAIQTRAGSITVTANQSPVASNVSVTGTEQVGETLEGGYAYSDLESDSEGNSTFKWYRADSSAGVGEQPISGADATTYVLQPEDRDKYIRFEVTPVAVTGTVYGTPVKSAWTGAIQVPKYRVLYEANGAMQGNVPVDSNQYEAGQEATVLGNTGNLEKTEHTFGGWTADQADNGISYTADDLLPIESADRTLYAKWIVNQYQVTFDSKGGSTVPSVQADYDSLIAAPQNPSRSDYSFEGWYKNQALTQTWSFTSDKVVADTTLYAKWSQNFQGGGGGGPVVPITPGNTLDVLINGQSESAAKAETKTDNGRTTTVVSVDGTKLESKLNGENSGGKLTIPIAVQSDSVAVELSAQTVKALQQKQMRIEFQTASGTYTLPASQIDMQAVSGSIGSSVPLEEIKVQLKIAKLSESQEKTVQSAIAKGDLTLVGEPLEFTVEASYGSRSVAITTFSSYVERSIVLPSGAASDRLTTGVVIDPDGTVRHVPTKVVQENGQYKAIFNSLTNSTYAVVWHPVAFKDVAGHWAKDAVNDMGSRLVISGIGDNQFKPDLDISRAEFTAIVVRALGLKQTKGAGSSYSDVNASAWYSGAIESAKAYKLVSGYADGTFHPTDKITREQAVLILANAMELTGLKAKSSVSADPMQRLGSFTDAAQVSDWARKAMAAVVEAEIVTGQKGNRLAAQSYITRAEVASLIQRLLQKSNLI